MTVRRGHEPALKVVRRVTRRQDTGRAARRKRTREERLGPASPQQKNRRRGKLAKRLDNLTVSACQPQCSWLPARPTSTVRPDSAADTPRRAQASRCPSIGRDKAGPVARQHLEYPRQRAWLAAPGRERQPVGMAGGRIRVLAEDDDLARRPGRRAERPERIGRRDRAGRRRRAGRCGPRRLAAPASSPAAPPPRPAAASRRRAGRSSAVTGTVRRAPCPGPARA